MKNSKMMKNKKTKIYNNNKYMIKRMSKRMERRKRKLNKI
jgi:hypothetical protein